MLAALAEQFGKEVRRAVDDEVLADEIRRGRDEPVDLDEAPDALEIAEGGLRLGQDVDGAKLRRALAAGDVDILAEVSLEGELAVFQRQLPGNVERRAGYDDREGSWPPAARPPAA